MKRLNSERGLSLVEATIILLVLSIMTVVIAPSLGDYVNDARDMKVKEDVEAIGTAIARLLRDSRQGCLVLDASSNSCTLTNRVDLLYSSGNHATVTADSYNSENLAVANALVNWMGHDDEPDGIDTMENQLVLNTPGGAAANQYADPTSSYAAGGPRSGIGWRGAYIASPVGPDPWGNSYQANTTFLNVANNVPGTDEGETSGGWRHDTFVISAGRNSTMETLFADATGTGATDVVGDDVVYIIQGSTR